MSQRDSPPYVLVSHHMGRAIAVTALNPAHVCRYGELLTPGQWVGVGSVCKRNGNPDQIEDILLAIKAQRPDLRLHGFGIKLEALKSSTVRAVAP